MPRPPLTVIVLAAGKGTRMRSAAPKVLHKVAGRSMVAHVLALAASLKPARTAIVVGPEMEAVVHAARAAAPGIEIFLQPEQKGTADAVLAARGALEPAGSDVVVLYADTPLIRPETIEGLRTVLDQGAAVAVLGFEPADPTGYGRLVTTGPDLMAIREHKDASAEERRIGLCNSGVMAFRLKDLARLLGRIGNKNANAEFYLTDAVALARADGLRAGFALAPESEVMGVNSRVQLAEAELILQGRLRSAAMLNGATMIAPDTVYLSTDTKIGRDVLIEPNVVFGEGVTIEDDVTILANCHLEGVNVGKGARIGPFARVRPGSVIGAKAHVGNFVELKATEMGEGAKANHLAYLGDGKVGPKANIGAGTIFCNYDGYNKSQTEIGAGAFVGSNSSLVAPVKVGDGAYIGSGSVITKDVPADALALERSEQAVKEGWAAKFRTLMGRRAKKS